jgi:hypothetical protein
MNQRLVCRIDKVYGDVVAEDGRYAILYAVNVGLGPLTLTGEQVVSNHIPSAGIRLRLRRAARLPRADASGQLRFGAAEWAPGCAAVERTFADAGHEFRWRCLCPGGPAVIRHAGGASLVGHGYLEHLSFALPPWELALGKLRWGRWLRENDSIVWVASAEAGFAFVARRGIAVAPDDIVAIGERSVETREFHLALAAVETIRKGNLQSTLSWPTARLLPRSLAAIDEDKSLFRGSLRERGSAGGAPTHGFAIAETVAFPCRGKEVPCQ